MQTESAPKKTPLAKEEIKPGTICRCEWSGTHYLLHVLSVSEKYAMAFFAWDQVPDDWTANGGFPFADCTFYTLA